MHSNARQHAWQHVTRVISRKMPQPRTAAHIFCQPAQSKCTSTCHKSRFVWKSKSKGLISYASSPSEESYFLVTKQTEQNKIQKVKRNAETTTDIITHTKWHTSFSRTAMGFTKGPCAIRSWALLHASSGHVSNRVLHRKFDRG